MSALGNARGLRWKHSTILLHWTVAVQTRSGACFVWAVSRYAYTGCFTAVKQPEPEHRPASSTRVGEIVDSSATTCLQSVSRGFMLQLYLVTCVAVAAGA